MPSTKTTEKLFERDCLDLYGASGEPSGEPLAPPARLGQAGVPHSERLVKAVLGRSSSGKLGSEKQPPRAPADIMRP